MDSELGRIRLSSGLYGDSPLSLLQIDQFPPKKLGSAGSILHNKKLLITLKFLAGSSIFR